MIGIINVNKPKGVTSSTVVVKIKKILGIKKVGHMGTLDPLASGVLPICIGKATRLFDYFLKKQKTYIAQFKFGLQTDSLDLEGEVIKTSNIIPSKQEVEIALKHFQGEINQVPPIYSSKKINGKKAYDFARKGETVDLAPCKVNIYKYKLLQQIDESTFEFEITCSAGTYIRSLARDLGEKLNSCATMVNLKRIKSGNFEISTAVDYEKLTKDEIISNLISLEEILVDFEKLILTQKDFQRLLNGLPVKIESLKENVFYSVYCEKEIIGIGEKVGDCLKLKTFLAN